MFYYKIVRLYVLFKSSGTSNIIVVTTQISEKRYNFYTCLRNFSKTKDLPLSLFLSSLSNKSNF